MAKDAANVVSEEGWETISAESGTPVRFDVGTVFVGTYVGMRHIVPPSATSEDDEFDQAIFVDPEHVTRTINPGYKLREALADIVEGQVVRITRMDDIPAKDAGKNDMKDFRVEVKK